MALIEYKNRHELPDDDAVVIFDHMNRTGGSTLARILASHYDAQSRIRANNEAFYAAYYEKMDHLRNIGMIYGHGARGAHAILPKERKSFAFTLLRHPLKQWMSIYKNMILRTHSEENPGSLQKRLDWFVYNSPQNRIVMWLGNGDYALAEKKLFEQYVFFGITEFLAESVHELGNILPWLKKEKIIHNVNMTQKIDMALSRAAEEYFMEKNSKDMQLYNKALYEFKRRTVNNACDVKIETDERSYVAQAAVKKNDENVLAALRQMKPLKMDDVVSAFFRYRGSADQCGEFFDCIKRYNLPEYKFFEFSCAIKLKNDEMNLYGNYIFDMLDRMDAENAADAFIDLRLNMLNMLLYSWRDFGKGTFSERCRSWLGSLRSVPGWRGVALNAEAVLLEKYGELDAAVLSAKGAVAAIPGDRKFHAVLCRLLLATGAVAEAENEARRELTRNPDSEWALRQLALVLSVKGERREARDMLGRVLKKNPALSEERKMLLNFLLDEKLHGEAEAVNNETLAYLPEWEHFNHFRMRIFESAGELSSAICELREMIVKNPSSIDLCARLADFMIRDGRIADLEKEADGAASAFPGEAWPFLLLSKVCGARGDVRQGLAHARKAHSMQPEKQALCENLAYFLRVANNREEFEGFVQKAIDADPRIGWPWRELCRMADARGDRSRALEMGAKALVAHPDDYEFKKYYNSLVVGKILPIK